MPWERKDFAKVGETEIKVHVPGTVEELLFDAKTEYSVNGKMFHTAEEAIERAVERERQKR